MEAKAERQQEDCPTRYIIQNITQTGGDFVSLPLKSTGRKDPYKVIKAYRDILVQSYHEP